MQKPIRVLTVVNSLDRGGAETMIMNLYRRMDKSKVQYDFVINKNSECDYESEARALGARIYRLPRFTGLNFIECKRAWDTFWTEHPEYKIVHGHLASSAFIYLKSAKQHGRYTIIHSHTARFRLGIAGVLSALFNYPTRYIADQFFGCSTEAGRLRYGRRVIASDKYRNFNNAIDETLFRFNQKTREEYRERLHLDEKKVLIHVGRFHEAKNHMFLLEIMAVLAKLSDEYRLILVGEGELRTQIENKIQELNLTDKVIMLGLRNDIPQLLCAGDFFVFPSLYEGLPCSVIEAVANGLPCLISDTISKEVCICDMVRQLPIDQGTAEWVETITSISDRERNIMTDVITKSGYNIDDTTAWLTDFYCIKERNNL